MVGAGTDGAPNPAAAHSANASAPIRRGFAMRYDPTWR
jgi:hypothetical protein